jgi:hypothetical protein
MASYSTTFDTIENPLVNDGTGSPVWTPGPGNAADVQTVAGGVVQSVTASTENWARLLTPSIGPNQYSRGTTGAGYATGGDLKCSLRSPSATGAATLAAFCNFVGAARIMTMDDALAGTLLGPANVALGTRAVGDVFELRAQGPTVVFLLNGAIRVAATQTTRTSGQPGFGFNPGTLLPQQNFTAWEGGDLSFWPGAGWPKIEDMAIFKNSTNATPVNAVIPPVNAGDLLIMAVGKDGADAVSWPASPAWSVITNAAGVIGGAGGGYGDARYRIVTGTEGWGAGGTISITNAAATTENYHMTAWRISGHDPAAAVECAFAVGDNTAPDPPNLTPSWGAANTLWITWAIADGLVIPTLWPTSYEDFPVGETTGGTAANACTAMCAGRSLNPGGTGAENPGAFTIPTEQWRALTLAIKPAAAVAGGIVRQMLQHGLYASDIAVT